MTKKKDPKDYLERGRPKWEPSPAQLKILEDSFKIGAKVKEALAQARISSSTFYDYYNENPDFAEQIDWWQQYPIMLAKHSVVKHMVKDGKLALEYLKCKSKDEFSTKQEFTGSVVTEKIFISKEEKDEALKHISEVIADGGNQ